MTLKNMMFLAPKESLRYILAQINSEANLSIVPDLFLHLELFF